MSQTAELQALDRVRRRVLTIGFLSIILQAAGALLWLAVDFRANDRLNDAVIMFIVSTAVFLMSAIGALVLLGRHWWSWFWVPLALAPVVVAVIWF